MWKLAAAWMVCAGCVLGTGTARAISFEERDFDALAHEADQIVIGTLTAANPRRIGAREIVTDYRFDNLETIKGTATATTLKLTMLGGTVGTDTLSVAGAPRFKRGVRYLVFVSGNGSVMFPFVGGHQGIFQVRTDAASGVSRVHDYAGRKLIRLPGRAAKALAESASVDNGEPMTEAAFVDAIRGKVAGKGAP